MRNNYDYEDDYYENKEDKKEIKILTPKEIKNKLDENVIGQEETKKKIATEIFKHYLRIQSNYKLTKNNILMIGLTGTGKTFMMQEIARILNIPIYIQDCTSLTSAGYVGDDIENCLKGLIQNANGDIEWAEKGIIVLDEFDKLSRKGENVSITRDVSGESVQQGMLKMIEGNVVKVPEGRRKHPQERCTEIDTKNILFVACGSFESIELLVEERLSGKNKNSNTIGFNANVKSKKEEISLADIRSNITRDDLKKYGILPEILGRFSVLSNLHPLEKTDLINILKNKNGLFDEYKIIFKLTNNELIVKDEVYEFIAETALKENIGARGLKSIVEDIMGDIMFEIPSIKNQTYILDRKQCEKVKILNIA